MRNGPKRTISASSGLELLQIVSDPVTEWCASEDARPLRGVDCEIPHRLERGTSASEDVGIRKGVDCEIPLVGDQNKVLFIRVWKPLPSKRVL